MATIPRPRAGSTTMAGVLILAVTAFFVAGGVDLARKALDPSLIDRETSLAATAFGLNPQAAANLTTILAFVVLGLCALTSVMGFGVLARRQGPRHAAIGTFVIFTLITTPLAISALSADPPASGAWIGVLVGLVDGAIVWLLAMPKTGADFERAEYDRQRARFAREQAQA
jgi:hypothetical protein